MLNMKFLPDWNKETVQTLKSSFAQKESIKHPRHRGDSREVDFQKVLKGCLPASIRVAKGFGLNTSSAVSREQDCLLLDRDTAWALADGGDISYFPIESILGSIEIKSQLNLVELRKAIINCISLKKLLYKGLPYNQESKPDERICYSIFAYTSQIPLKKLCQVVNDLSAQVPHALRINMIYVLNEGILMPSSASRQLAMNFEQAHCEGDAYASIDALGTKSTAPDHTVTFQWFIANNVDHCLFERAQRKTPSYCSYVFHPIKIQMFLEDIESPQ